MQTPQEFLEFFEAIPEDQWTNSVLFREEGTRCALGHLGVRSYLPENNDAVVIHNVNILSGLLRGEENHNFDTSVQIVWRVNDSNQAPPKTNMLNALRRKKSKENN